MIVTWAAFLKVVGYLVQRLPVEHATRSQYDTLQTQAGGLLCREGTRDRPSCYIVFD